MSNASRYTQHHAVSPAAALGDEPMVSARQAAALLRLPHYWFATPLMRERFRIPHYTFGDLVRYRIADLCLWVERHAQTSITSVEDASRNVT